MTLVILSFVAGFLSVLAPCSLPLLPVILGGSLTGSNSRRQPYVIVASLIVSLVFFTVVLKLTTGLIGVSPAVWQVLSGGIIIALGVVMLKPGLWEITLAKTGLQPRFQSMMDVSRKHNGLAGEILTGSALGPVFSSCSPMYAWVIATVLPESTLRAGIYLGFYCIGLAIGLLLIALSGRRVTAKLGKLSNPSGWFQRSIAIIFILVGLAVSTGLHKTAQSYLVGQDFFDFKTLEQKLVPED